MYQLPAACALLFPLATTLVLPQADRAILAWPTDACVFQTGTTEFAAHYRAIQQACHVAKEGSVSGLYFIYSHDPLGCCVGCSHTTPYVAIEPAKGYAMFETGGLHQDAIVAYDFGAVTELQGSRLVFSPDKRSSPTAKEKTFLAIRWGGQRYLVLESQMIDFCNQFNSNVGRGMPFGPGFVHWEDRLIAASGRPEVPENWKTFLLKRPIEGRVTAVKKLDAGNELLTYQISLSTKAVEELKPGMTIWLYRPPLSRKSQSSESATIVKFEAEGYTATTQAAGVAKGWGFSTLPPNKRGKLTDPLPGEDAASDENRSPPERKR